jgi:hypothetical protein
VDLISWRQHLARVSFDSRLEMTDAIKGVMGEIALDYCGICENMIAPLVW